jgi:hypothetical protein
MTHGFQQSDLKRPNPLEVYKADAAAGGLKSVRVGNDALLTKAIAEHPERKDEYVDLVQKVTDAIDDRLTGGVSFTRTTFDPFAAAGIEIADYYERRGGGTYVFRIDDLFRDIEAYRGPGQAAMFPRGASNGPRG